MNYTILTSEEQIRKALNVLSQTPVTNADTETTDLTPRKGKLRLIQLSDSVNTFIIDVFKLNNVRELDCLIPFFRSDQKFIFHNWKFDSIWIRHYLGIHIKNVFCTYLAAKLVDMSSDAGLAEVLEKYLGVIVSKEEQRSDWSLPELSKTQYDYAARDVIHLSALREKLIKELFQTGQQDTAKIEFEAASVTGQVEEAGFPIDQEMWLRLSKKLEEDRDAKEKLLLNLIAPKTQPDIIQQSMFGMPDVVVNPDEFNPRSWQQVIKAYGKLGIELPSTNEKVLIPIARNHPEVKLLIDHRHADKAVSTYGKAFLFNEDGSPKDYFDAKTGRIYSTFWQLLPSTGRFSSQGPNIQNIPGDPMYRECFRPVEAGKVFVIADLSQIELRVLAHISQDKVLMEAFEKKQDLHSITAKGIYKLDCPLKDIPKKYKTERHNSKIVNFQTIYKVSAVSLADKLGVTKQEAQKMINGFYSTYPQAKKWLFAQEELGLRNRETKTLSGRIVKINYDVLDGKTVGNAQRLARNAPIQGCLDSRTKIFVKGEGYSEIKNFDNQLVEFWDGDQFATGFVKYAGKKQLVRVTTFGRNYIECSPDHKFLTTNSHGVSRWLTISEISKLKQSYLRLTNKLPQWKFDLRVEKPKIENSKFWRPWQNKAPVHNYKDLSIDMIKSKFDLGVWLGRLASDGSVCGHDLTLLIAEHEEEILKYLENLTSKFGVFRKTVTREANAKFRGSQRMTSLSLSSTALVRQLLKNGIKDRIPDFVWRDSKCLQGYLRGMFDGDGTVNLDNISLKFGKEQTHKKWAEDIQQALLFFGIRSRLHFNSGSINVSVLKRDCELFGKIVGFLNLRKQEKVKKIKPQNNAMWELKNLKNKRFSNIYKNSMRVKTVEFTDKYVDMYDVMDSNTGKFMANGFVVHNSAADLFKRSLPLVYNELQERYPNAKLVNLVHDEIIAEVDEKDAQDVKEILVRNMTKAAKEFLSVPVITEGEVGESWASK